MSLSFKVCFGSNSVFTVIVLYFHFMLITVRFSFKNLLSSSDMINN